MISIIMSTYKEEERLLRESIESILSQSYKDFEYIIILDNPENVVHKQVISEYEQKDKRIRFYINEKNMGLTSSLNRGLSLAKGEYIARMDADDISLPERLSSQIQYLTGNNFDLVGGITQMIDEDGNDIYSIQKVPTDFEKIKKCLKYGQVIAHPTWLGKREVFDTLHGYRKMPLCEDFDFTLRAVLKGFKVSNIDKIVLKYRMTSQSISRNNLFEQYLYMRYITNEYAHGSVASIEDAKNYVQSHNNEKDARKYAKANVIFNEALQNLTDKKLGSFIVNGFKLLFSSKYFLNKIYRFMMLTLNS
ncbi:glycosyltransferase [Floccifex sp.]|uniref:glycosyltransferase n=1 Tax=Floccifex sp. TaxID=2815810 RepID=UPI002A74BE24|nr:glycosyltransferase [Floccifex sp.]MDD7281955.1 glycosyltransferase [Erysipelotrichaceae bacterium]MDY2957850.1 glycosyltransferase [Floccifex sp.]